MVGEIGAGIPSTRLVYRSLTLFSKSLFTDWFFIRILLAVRNIEREWPVAETQGNAQWATLSK